MSVIRASVVVPTYARPRFLADALSCLAKQDLDAGSFEVLVVDNSPKLGFVRQIVLEGRSPAVEVRYIADPRAGAYNARHLAAQLARGEILAYIDDDVLMGPDWLQSLLGAFTRPDVGCVGGRVRVRWEDGSAPPWFELVPGEFFSILDYGDQAVDLEPPLSVNSCNMAIRREAIWTGGGFRPCVFGKRRHVWLSGEGEGGLVRQLHQLGIGVRYEPAAEIQHRMPSSRTTLAYARRRAHLMGIQHSFAWSRVRRPSAGRSLVNAAACFTGAAQAAVGHKPIRRAYWLGRGTHQLGFALLPPFRRYVLRPSYLSDSAVGVADATATAG